MAAPTGSAGWLNVRGFRGQSRGSIQESGLAPGSPAVNHQDSLAQKSQDALSVLKGQDWI